MLHERETLLDDLYLGGESWLAPGAHELVELWLRALRPIEPPPSAWERILRSLDAEDAALN